LRNHFTQENIKHIHTKGGLSLYSSNIPDEITLSSYYIIHVLRLLSIKRNKNQNTYTRISLNISYMVSKETEKNKNKLSWVSTEQGGIKDCHKVKTQHQLQQYSILTTRYDFFLETSILKHICSIYESRSFFKEAHW